jgi:hypothetical protein
MPWRRDEVLLQAKCGTTKLHHQGRSLLANKMSNYFQRQRNNMELQQPPPSVALFLYDSKES